MSNILIDQLPTAVEVGGHEYRINSDFRTGIRILLAYEDDELTAYEKQMITLENLYPKIPEDTQGAIEQAMKFLNGGKAETAGEEDLPMRLYSFSKDAELIFSAFRQTHGIDLETAKLHWWSFLALFMDIGADTTFCNLVSLRKRIKTGKASKEELQSASEMGDLMDIPELDTRTPDERDQERAFMEQIQGQIP